MKQWDTIIVGAGSAGCVLAERLSANPAHQVLLLEAGPADRHPMIHMPRGAALLHGDPRHAWFFRTEAHDGIPAETWLRGKMLGGSSAINGMNYFRGQPQDYDTWEALGARGWGWHAMSRAFRAIEDHELGDDGIRGAGGPLPLSLETLRTPFTEAFIKAGQQLGLPRVDGLGRPEQESIGYTTRTIARGRRQSSATAFLGRAKGRPNLTILTGFTAERVLFEGRRATAVAGSGPGNRPQVLFAHDEIILSSGALMSPLLLQRSGIGDADHLASLGIPVVAHSPGVGRHMLEHRLHAMQFGLTVPHSHNPHLRGLRALANGARWFLGHDGPMASGNCPAGAFVRALPDAETPDVEILLADTVAWADGKGGYRVDRDHSITLHSYPLRSRSEGSIAITAADPAAPPRIRAGYLSDPYDQSVTVAMHRYLRTLMQQPAIAPMVGEERESTRALQTDDDIVDAFRTRGNAGFHACSTCRMGDFPDAVLDEKLRVRGVAGLRVVDGSIMPTMVSANTNGPIMASAWHAAGLILEGRNR